MVPSVIKEEGGTDMQPIFYVKCTVTHGLKHILLPLEKKKNQVRADTDLNALYKSKKKNSIINCLT